LAQIVPKDNLMHDSPAVDPIDTQFLGLANTSGMAGDTRMLRAPPQEHFSQS
jgi:hypothetical protein